MFFLYKRMSLAGISQSSIDSFGMAFTFLLADSSADEARARGGRRVDVGDDDTDRDDLEGLFVLLAVFAAAAATAAAMVVAKEFAGLNRVKQHQMVYKALKGKMDGPAGELHALALTTAAPD